MGSLTGKTAVVLGASAQGGTGWATAELFAAEGAKVTVGARRLEGVQALAGQIGGTAVRCDAADEDEVRRMAETAAAAYGKIDIAILAAGTPFVGTLDEIDSADFRQAAAINYFGVYYFIKHMARHMVDNGSIVVISSMSTTSPIPGYAAYAAAKGAANTLVKYAALEYAPRGIRVNGILAGLIQSPMTDPIRAHADVWKVFLKEIPLGRAVMPVELGHACLWLSSPHCAVTGVCLNVDNGNHLRRPPQPEEIPSSVYDEAATSAGY